MRGESQVEIALLVLLTAAYYPSAGGNSELIGEAAGCNPVIVRRVYKQLKDAGLLDTRPGRYGLRLARDAEDITLLDVVEALRPLNAGSVFGMHAPLSGTSPMADSIFALLSESMGEAIGAMKERLEGVTLGNLVRRLPSTYDVSVDEKCEAVKQYMAEAEKRHP